MKLCIKSPHVLPLLSGPFHSNLSQMTAIYQIMHDLLAIPVLSVCREIDILLTKF